MKNLFKLTILLIFLSGCMSTADLTNQERHYLHQSQMQETTFNVDSFKVEKVWGRAQSFIAKHSSYKIQNVTDYVIQTYYPASGEAGFAYKVTKTDLDNGKFEISVSCITGNVFMNDRAERNEHVMAFYIKTGNRPSENLISE